MSGAAAENYVAPKGTLVIPSVWAACMQVGGNGGGGMAVAWARGGHKGIARSLHDWESGLVIVTNISQMCLIAWHMTVKHSIGHPYGILKKYNIYRTCVRQFSNTHQRASQATGWATRSCHHPETCVSALVEHLLNTASSMTQRVTVISDKSTSNQHLQNTPIILY